MSSKLSICCALCCLPFGSNWAFADESIPLSIDEAVIRALSGREEMSEVTAQIAGAKAKVAEAKGAFLPTIKLYTDTMRIDNYDTFSGINVSGEVAGQFLSATITRTVPTYQQFSGVEMALNLYAGGLTTANLEGARAEERAAETGQSVENRLIIVDVVTAYCNLKHAQIEAALAAEALELADERQQIADVRAGGGQTSELEQDRARLELLEAQIRRSNAVGTLNVVWQRYELALGLPAESQGVNPELVDDSDSIDVRSILKYIGIPRPEMVRARENVQDALAKERAQRSEFWPVIDLYVRFNQIGRAYDNLQGAYSDYHKQDFTVGVRVQWNIFNGWQSVHRVERAAADYTFAESNLRLEESNQQRLAIDNRLRVETLNNDVALAEKRLEIARLEARIAQAQQSSERIAAHEYRAKLFSIKEAEGTLKMAKLDRLVARLAAAMSEADSNR
jgi:outer membrane protein TolC